MIWYDWYDVIGMIDMTWYDMMWYDMMWYYVIWCDTIRWKNFTRKWTLIPMYSETAWISFRKHFTAIHWSNLHIFQEHFCPSHGHRSFRKFLRLVLTVTCPKENDLVFRITKVQIANPREHVSILFNVKRRPIQPAFLYGSIMLGLVYCKKA